MTLQERGAKAGAKVVKVPRTRLPHEGGDGQRYAYWLLTVDGVEHGAFFSQHDAWQYYRLIEQPEAWLPRAAKK